MFIKFLDAFVIFGIYCNKDYKIKKKSMMYRNNVYKEVFPFMVICYVKYNCLFIFINVDFVFLMC